jgi:hypothetical protein
MAIGGSGADRPAAAGPKQSGGWRGPAFLLFAMQSRRRRKKAGPRHCGKAIQAQPAPDQIRPREARRSRLKTRPQELRPGDHPPLSPGRPGQTVKGRDVNRLDRGSAFRPMRGQRQTSISAPRRRHRVGSLENVPREGRYCDSTEPNEMTFSQASIYASLVEAEGREPRPRPHLVPPHRRLIRPSRRRPAHLSGAASGVR